MKVVLDIFLGESEASWHRVIRGALCSHSNDYDANVVVR